MIIITVTIYILADIISYVKALCGFMDYVKALYGLYGFMHGTPWPAGSGLLLRSVLRRMSDMLPGNPYELPGGPGHITSLVVTRYQRTPWALE